MPTHVCIVAPNSKLDLVEELLLFDLTNQPNLYTSTDVPVRAPTHKKMAGPMTVSQRTAVDAWVDDPPTDDSDPRWGILVGKFEKIPGVASPLASFMAQLGLTDTPY